MNSRRSRSVKLVSAARASRALEVDIAGEEEEDGRMSSSADNTVYCCVAKGRKVIYRYSSKDGDGDPATEAAAALCLEHAPAHHRHYVHTAGHRSYAFLMGADGHTFFAIIDPTVGNAGALQFLARVRDAFRSHAAGRNGFHDSLVPAVRRLVASLEKMPHAAFVLEDGGGGGGSPDVQGAAGWGRAGAGRTRTSPPGISWRRQRRGTARASSTVVLGGSLRIDMPAAEEGSGGGMSLERMRRQQQPSRSVWMRHDKIIVVVDAVICLALFAAWLAVCKGFKCVSGGG